MATGCEGRRNGLLVQEDSSDSILGHLHISGERISSTLEPLVDKEKEAGGVA